MSQDAPRPRCSPADEQLRQLLAVAVIVATTCPVLPAEKGKEGAKEKERRAGIDINGWGRLGSTVKGSDDFYQFTSYEKDASGKLLSVKCLLRIPEKTEILVDQQIRIEDLAADDALSILGRVMTREVPGRGGGAGLGGGRGGRDRQIQNARAILTGKDVEVQKSYKDPTDKSLKWLEATVVNSASGLWVKYQGEDYRVTLEKAAPILRRGKAERKFLRSGAYLIVVGERTDPPSEEAAKDKAKPGDKAKGAVGKKEPGKKSDDGRLAYQARRVIILDPRYLKSAYAAILP